MRGPNWDVEGQNCVGAETTRRRIQTQGTNQRFGSSLRKELPLNSLPTHSFLVGRTGSPLAKLDSSKETA
ncbi:hypothetical protein Nepgr_021572 [Nepenthes gracilis]|uniref:Uncharacterized protein n=1 Tax=Nepenthes gracilis TaxID=150966 RepID=A0AAD3T157_NEPGR|nr:hypothetical protein Nepgr_021572 [Nepenthes gracilis]